MKNFIIRSFALVFLLLSASGAMAQTKGKLDRSVKPKAGPAPKVQIGKMESFQLENGLKVFVVENHKLPKVSFSLQLNIDPILEGDKAGYSALTAELLATATEKRTKDQINEETDFIGASLFSSPEGIYASSLKKHQDKLLDLMSDVLLHPVFKQEELDKAKTQMISGLVSSKNEPAAMSSNIQGVLLYGKNHPYGEITTEETVSNVTLEDCKNYYNTYFKPNIAYLAIVGDITLEEAKKVSEKYFGSWKKGEVPSSKIPDVNPTSTTSVAFVPRPGSVQSVVKISYTVDLKPNSKDLLAAKVMNEVLGGGSSARLFRNLRETYNLTYGAYSSLSENKYVGKFQAYGDIRSSGTDSSVNEFLLEMKRMREEKITQEELQGVINNMTGNFAMSLENPATIASFAINIDKYGLPADYYETYLSRLSQVTVDDVYDAAQKYMRPDACNIIIVGDRDVVKDFNERWKGKIKYYDQYGNDFVEIRKAPEGMTGEQVVNNYLKAIGGVDNLKKVKSNVTKMTTSMQGMTLEIVSKKQYPKKKGLVMSNESVTMNGMLVNKTVFNGTKSKRSGMMGEAEVTGEELEEMKLDAEPYAETRLKELGYTLELSGIDKVDGKDAYLVVVTDKKGNKEERFYDVESSLLVKTHKVQKTPQGDMDVTVLFMDYKEVSGIKYPHRIKNEAGPQSMDLKVTSIEVNGKIDKKEFEIK